MTAAPGSRPRRPTARHIARGSAHGGACSGQCSQVRFCTVSKSSVPSLHGLASVKLIVRLIIAAALSYETLRAALVMGVGRTDAGGAAPAVLCIVQPSDPASTPRWPCDALLTSRPCQRSTQRGGTIHRCHHGINNRATSRSHTSIDATPPVWYGWLSDFAASQQEDYGRMVASDAISVGRTAPLSRPLFWWERFRHAPGQCTPAPMPAISSCPSVDGCTGGLDRIIHATGPAPRGASDRSHPCRVAQ